MNEVFIAIGSNMGNREEAFRSAISYLESEISNLETSDWYDTPAMNMLHGHDARFLNAVLKGETALDPQQLLQFIQKIEKDLGRKRDTETGYTARIIDLDILFFNEACINEKGLVIPHPRIKERLFVLQPLMDLAPEKIIPGQGKMVKELYKMCIDNLQEDSDEVTL